MHYDALDVSKDCGHDGHGCAEVVYCAPSAQSLCTQRLETAALRNSPVRAARVSPRGGRA